MNFMNLWKVLRGKEKLTGQHVLAFGVLIIGFLVFTSWSVAYTSSSNFCSTCHEITPMHATWQTSSHKNVDCVACHAQPGFAGVVQTKAKGLKEVYVHLTDNNITLKADAKDINCYSCHQDKVKTDTQQAADRKDPHTVKHFDNGMNCITCHSGLVHNEKTNKGVPSRDACVTCHLDQMKK